MRKIDKIKRIVAGLLGVLMLTSSMLPMSAFAAEVEPEVQQEVVAETEPDVALPKSEPDIPDGKIIVKKIDARTGLPLADAWFVVFDEEENEIATKVTDDTGTIEFVVPLGRYELGEIEAPYGYENKAIFINVEVTTEQSEVTLEFENDPIFANSYLTKVDADTWEPLAGAEFEIYDHNHQFVMSGITDENGSLRAYLPVGQYFYREVKAPKGYELDSQEYPFRVRTDKIMLPELIPNKKSPNVIISKRDMDGAELVGAELQLRSLNTRETIKTWITTDTPEKFVLEPGEYMLLENNAPEGYGVAYPICFTVNDDGTIQTSDTGALADDGRTLVMIDKQPQTVTLRKTVVGKDNDAEYVFVGLFSPEIQKISVYHSDGTLKSVKEGNTLPSKEAFMLTLKGGEYAEITGFVNRVIIGEYCCSDFTTEIKQDGVIYEATEREERELRTTIRDFFQKSSLDFEEYDRITGDGEWKYTRYSVGIKDADIEFINTYPTPPKTSVKLSKQDVSGKELPGAKMELYAGDKAQGKVLESWTSGTNPYEVTLESGTYTMHEVIAPDGYEIATDITFVVNEDGTVTAINSETIAEDNVIVMVDEAKPVVPNEPEPTPSDTPVKLSKQDVSGKELPGAKMELYAGDKAQGKVLESWTSGTKPYEVTLESGTYTMHEVIAPDGYEIATDITFVVNEDGTVTAINSETIAEDNVIVMVDEAKPVVPNEPEPTPSDTPVKLSKQDVSGKELPGAKMELYAGDKAQGKVLESWTSGTKPYEVTLESGTYTMHEVIAPDGYEIATDIVFIVDAEKNTVVLKESKTVAKDNVIVMVDEAKPTPEQPKTEEPKPSTPANPEVPKTGDETNLTLWYALAVIMLIGSVSLGYVVFHTSNRKKKK